MSEPLAAMLEEAGRALVNAHAPYSRFRVGACLRAASGHLYAGCNVENAAYPVGQCAEATAIGAMVAAGDRQIVEVVVLTEGAAPCPPCGRCRQQLAEFATPGTPVHLCGPEGVRVTATLGELLPMAFGAGGLGRPGAAAPPAAGSPPVGSPPTDPPPAGSPAAGPPAAGMPPVGAPAAGSLSARPPAAGLPPVGSPATGAPDARPPAAASPPAGLQPAS
jgi:cytidine deaminase